MTTTLRAAGVTVAQLAHALTEQLLQVRRVYLKRRAPKNRYVHQLRRDIACGKARPIEMVLSLSFADIDDGASLQLVHAWYDSAKAIIAEYYEERMHRRAGHVGAILPLVQREARTDAELRAAENDLLAHPESLEAQRRVETAVAAHEAEQDRLVAAVRATTARAQMQHATQHQHAVAVSC